MLHIDFLVPGNINLPTGGYIYDREIIAALDKRDVRAAVWQLDEDLWSPASCEAAAVVLAGLEGNSIVMLDGLALAPLSDIIIAERGRLRFCALMHHPAALETGLAQATAVGIAAREAAALREMECIICTSDWTARQLGGSGISGDIVRAVNPGVDEKIARQRANTIRRAPDIAHADGLRLLCVATITPRKGHERLIAAVRELAEFAWQLDCIGSQSRNHDYATHIDSLINHHGLSTRIRLHGEVEAADLATAYARADLFVLASHLEGYGMAFAEAQAAGLPIVATGGGAVTETLQQAAAVIVDDQPDSLANALRTLLSDRKAWSRLANAAKAAATPVRNWDQAAGEFAAALRGMLTK